MFESVVPEAVVRPSRRTFFGTLPVSLALHATAVAGVMVASLWNVGFPDHSPHLYLAYSLTKLPDPPPPPLPPPAAPKTAVKAPALPKPAAPPPALAQIVAPTVIPDLIPEVVEALPAPPLPVVEAPPPAVDEHAAHAAPAGDAKGVPGGDLLGKKFGVTGGIVFGDDGKVHVDRHEKLPLKVLDQEFPAYPEAARKERLEDRCVIRYTIGLNGRVTDIEITERAKNEMFETASVDVVRRWRFRPMRVDGKPVEVVHEVEFFYQFTQR